MSVIDFQGKSVVYAHHVSIPIKPIDICNDKSLNDHPNLDDNLIVHGDNLYALKALLPQYVGKINCIYIDPPYNTGKKWLYDDNSTSPLLKAWLKDNVSVDKIDRHDRWLCMMWPRLQLLKKLLAEDGVIFISIDDNEQHRLRMLMDEIFGEENFITNIIWQKKYAPANDAKHFSNNHDFVICYAKKSSSWKIRLLPRTEKQDKRYNQDDGDGRGPWHASNLSAKTYSSDYDYPIINPNTQEEHWPPRSRCWRTSKVKMQELIDDNRIYFGRDGKSGPKLKRYLNEVKQGLVPLTVWTHDVAGNTAGARKLLKNIFHERKFVFENPKAIELLKRIIKIAADKDAIILDSFAGSGTTAHAVLDLNKEDNGNRKFIMIECEEYADEITAERIRRVIKDIGGSFTYCELH